MLANQFCKTGWLSVDLERAAINQATSLEGARPMLGGADFSQSHRATQETEGKIAGYDGMSFTQRRVAQMSQMLSRPGYRGGGSRGER
jgi:hypothetical protein